MCLLIDDDKDEFEIFSIALRQVNRQATCLYAQDGGSALDRLRKEDSFFPDVIFIDMNMPKMNGMQCLTEIRSIERLHKVPVYMYSTSSSDRLVEESKLKGAVDYIVKSVSIYDTEQQLSEIIKRIETANLS